MKSVLQNIHDEVNALGGRPDQDNSYDQGIVDTIDKVLEIVERAQVSPCFGNSAQPVAWRVDGLRNGKPQIWFYYKPEWPGMHEEHGDKVTPLYAAPVTSTERVALGTEKCPSCLSHHRELPPNSLLGPDESQCTNLWHDTGPQPGNAITSTEGKTP